MTVDDVKEARDELAAEGNYPSANMIVAWLQKNGMPATKRTVLKHLHQLGSIETREKRVPLTKSMPADPVAVAVAMLSDAESTLETSRAAMGEAALELLLSQGFIHLGTRYGAWLPSDPALDEVAKAAVHTQDSYRRAMAQGETARDQVAHVKLKHRRERQERHVHLYQPELVETLAHWQEQLRIAPSDRMHAHAKREVMIATEKYHRATAEAPVGDDHA